MSLGDGDAQIVDLTTHRRRRRRRPLTKKRCDDVLFSVRGHVAVEFGGEDAASANRTLGHGDGVHRLQRADVDGDAKRDVNGGDEEACDEKNNFGKL